MSIEESLESIAGSLEILANTLKTKNGTPPPMPITTGAPDMLPPSTAKKGKKKTEVPAVTPTATATPPAAEVSKQDITTTLQAFLKKFPGEEGATKARVFFTAAGAKNITTLDPLKYKEVFLGLQNALK